MKRCYLYYSKNLRCRRTVCSICKRSLRRSRRRIRPKGGRWNKRNNRNCNISNISNKMLHKNFIWIRIIVKVKISKLFSPSLSPSSFHVKRFDYSFFNHFPWIVCRLLYVLIRILHTIIILHQFWRHSFGILEWWWRRKKGGRLCVYVCEISPRNHAQWNIVGKKKKFINFHSSSTTTH